MLKILLTAFNARYSHSSIAIRYIKAYNSSKNIDLMEFSINDNIHYAYSKLIDKKADVYCFSVYIWNIEITLKVAQMVKKALPNCKIVLGGPECSYNPKEILNKNRFIDYIILGEGEKVTGMLIECLENHEEPEFDGIASRNYIGNQAPCMELSQVIFPYTSESLKELKNKIIYFETSRGCPFKCAYCLSSIEKGIRYFPMEYVKKGFDMFFKNNVPLVKLIDRTFNADPKRAVEIAKYIIKNSKNTKVHFEIDPGILTNEFIDVLASAPKDLFQLEMGIQSINKNTLGAVNRTNDIEKISKNIEKLKAANNMHLHLDLIAGLPYEDYKSFEKSFNYVFSLNPDMLQLGFLKVLHGTPIEQTDGIIYADFPPYEVISTKWIRADEICKLKLIDKAVDGINNSGAFKMTIQKITVDNPFKAFERISKIFDTDIILSRFDIYDELYKIYGEEIFEELIFDFMLSNKGRPMPKFANIEYPKSFKKNCIKATKTDDLENVRFEPVKDKIYMVDYNKNEIVDITKEYKKVAED